MEIEGIMEVLDFGGYEQLVFITTLNLIPSTLDCILITLDLAPGHPHHFPSLKSPSLKSSLGYLLDSPSIFCPPALSPQVCCLHIYASPLSQLLIQVLIPPGRCWEMLKRGVKQKD